MALSALPFAASGVLVGADNRAVNQMQRSQRLFRQCPEYPQPHAFLGPSVEAVIDRRVGPYRSGRARHGEPVRKMEKMPLRTRRSSWRGTPRGLFGNTGAMIPNSTSAKSNRAIVQASVVWKLESQVTLSRKPPLWVQKLGLADAEDGLRDRWGAAHRPAVVLDPCKEIGDGGVERLGLFQVDGVARARDDDQAG